VETASGVVVTSRDELESIVKAELAGTDLVSELLAERRAAAQRDDRA
jgi:UDP-N-acetyl-D-mannosaminuronic acid transferase (WecB/TagA/CpsF family)